MLCRSEPSRLEQQRLMMTALQHGCLLMALFLPVVMAMPEPISEGSWEPPAGTPPTPFSVPRLNVPGRLFYHDGDNSTDPPPSLEAYCQMLLQVPVPSDQIPWFCLCTHCQNNHGPKGDHGDRGPPGQPGSPGRRGMTGLRGPPGFLGRPGVKGQKGDEGYKGERGPAGLLGPKGERGFKGDKGDRGLEGRPGDQGPKGGDGVCPDTCESSYGPPGQPGLPGPAGPRGLPGVMGPQGPTGFKGDMGDLGPPGLPGVVGDKGDKGLIGECNCTDGVDGANGQTGQKGEKGEQGPIGITGKGGPEGKKGDMGVEGIMGPPGPCMPNIQSAFAAGLTSSYPPPNAPVIFSHIHHNIQRGYDPDFGIYTAPVNGTYVFSYHFTVHERVLKAGLFHNFVPVIKTTDPKVLGTTSHSVVLHLVRGDKVWIQVKDSVTNGMYAGSETSSTFSGFLLHPDRCDVPVLRGPLPHLVPPEAGYSWGD